MSKFWDAMTPVILKVDAGMHMCMEHNFFLTHSWKQHRKGPDRLVHQTLTVPTTINPEKSPAAGSRPGSILT